MSERKAEVLMTAAIIACSISFVFSKMGLSTMGAFNILAARFLLAFILLFALLGKKMMGRLDRCTVLGGALVGFLFFLVMSCEMLALKTAHAGTVSLLENLCSPDRQTSRGLLFSDRHLIRLFIFRQPSLDPGFAFYDSPHDADIIFSQTPVLDDLGHDLQSRQGTSSCHDAACVAVEAVADGRAEARQVLFL